jgi:hypothetical protein
MSSRCQRPDAGVYQERPGASDTVFLTMTRMCVKNLGASLGLLYIIICIMTDIRDLETIYYDDKYVSLLIGTVQRHKPHIRWLHW